MNTKDDLNDPKLPDDYRFLMVPFYWDQFFCLCSLIHNTASNNKPIVSYDIIGMLFARSHSHCSIIDEFNKSLLAQKDHIDHSF